MALIWLFQFNLLSILTPRYLTESVGYNLFPFNFIFMLKSKRVPFRLKRKLVSETYNEILLALTLSGRLACTAYHEKLSIFPGGTPGVTWLKKRFMWQMNRQYRKFFNESKIDRIRYYIQKTRPWLFIWFGSNYILSFVNRERKRKFVYGCFTVTFYLVWKMLFMHKIVYI